MSDPDFQGSILSPDADLSEVLASVEDRLAHLQHQVTSLQRLASLGTMSAMLAHEFNNLLTPIVSYAQYALSRGKPDELKTAVEKTLRTANRMSGLCGRIMGMASDEPPDSATVEIEKVVRDAAECLGRNLASDNVQLSIDIPAGMSARAHEPSLHQVIYNLLLNARQAMLDRGGRLMVRARSDAGTIVIDVTDTGPGIAPESLPHIFEPFFSTKRDQPRPDRSGLGLGLHVCKRLMQQQSGSIDVASMPGNGTTFTLRLPAA